MPGRSGTLTVFQGTGVYDDVSYKITCVAKDSSRIDDIFEWLQGMGPLVLANRPNTEYIAVVTGAIEFERVLRGRTVMTVAVTFRCKPFGYKLPKADAITVTHGYDLVNPGNAPAQPKITVVGKGNLALSIGMQTMFLTDLSASEPIVLDCELCDALDEDETMLMNNQVEGDFFEIPPGHSTVQFTAMDAGSSFTSVSILPRWRMM